MRTFLKQGAIISTEPGMAVIGYGDLEKRVAPGKGKGPYFYFPDFFLKDPAPWLTYRNSGEHSLEDLKAFLPEEEPPSSHQWSVQGEGIYSEAFKDLQKAFSSEELKKAVPYLFYTSAQPFNLSRSLAQLLHHPAFLYGFWENGEGVLGGTPEYLLHIDPDGMLETAAIAGTVASGDEAKLLRDPKLNIEHEWVIEGICQALAPFGKVEVGEKEVLRLAHLSHAKTPLRMQLHQTDCLDKIIDALHPTPALGAFPKEPGNRWLTAYAKHLPRGRYGAPAGVKIGGHFYCYVAIRNVQWDKKGTRLGVGGGVVSSSIAVDERKELALKFAATCSMLGIV